jgi:uncharacterized protein YycO
MDVNTATRVQVDHCPPGTQLKDPRPGEFILTHQRAWTSRCIQWGQRLRFHGRNRRYTYWNHAALIINAKGDLIEALGSGVVLSNIAKYAPGEYHVVRVQATAADRAQAVAFAQSCLGQQYGRLTILSIALALLTGGRLSFGLDGQHICSGLVARALERIGEIFDRTPSHITPADLAMHYRVQPPTGEQRQMTSAVRP